MSSVILILLVTVVATQSASINFTDYKSNQLEIYQPYELVETTGFVGDLFELLKKAALSTGIKFGELLSKIFEQVKQFFGNAKLDAKGILLKFIQVSLTFKKYANMAIDVVSDEIYGLLENIEGKVFDVLCMMDTKFEEAMNKANTTLFNATRQLQNFQLQMVAELVEAPIDIEAQGLDILNAFVEKSIDDCYSCSSGAIDPIKILYKKAKDLIESTLPVGRGVIEGAEICLRENPFDPKTLLQCIKEVKEDFQYIVSKLPLKIVDLQGSVMMVVVEEILNIPCIIRSRTTIESGKKEIRKTIISLVHGTEISSLSDGNKDF